MSWIYQGKELIEEPLDFIGFVYIIRNKLTNKKYIGKKLFKFSSKKQKTVLLKSGIKKKKIIKGKVSSDWLSYYGSNLILKNEVKELGSENFDREIIWLCKSKAECSYRETWEIFTRNCLLSEEYYNSWVSTRINRSHVFGKFEN